MPPRPESVRGLKTSLRPPQYETFKPPSAGGSYVDPAFQTTVHRISDARATLNAADTALQVNIGTLAFIIPEYATPAAFNSSNTHLLLQHQSYFALYVQGDGGGYVFRKNLPLDVNAATEPRWSRTNPNLVYYKTGNTLKQCNVRTLETAVVRQFHEYQKISGNGESDICFDGDHMVIVGDDREIFVFTISSRKKGPVLDTGGFAFDSVYITASDQVTVTWQVQGTSRTTGIELYDQDMKFVRQLAHAGGHMDVGKDVDGSPVLVWISAADAKPVCNNGITKIDLSTGEQTCLLTLDWSLAVHVACCDQGWAVVSTYAPSDPKTFGADWPTYTNEILRISLDGHVVQRLVHHRSRPLNAYVWQAWANVSRDGSRIVYASNMGLGGPKDYADTYLVQVRQ